MSPTHHQTASKLRRTALVCTLPSSSPSCKQILSKKRRLEPLSLLLSEHFRSNNNQSIISATFPFLPGKDNTKHTYLTFILNASTTTTTATMGSTTVSNDKRQTSRRLVRQRPTAANSCSCSCRRRNDNDNQDNGGLKGFHCRILSWLCALLLLAASATASTNHVSYLRRQRGKPLNQEDSAAAAVVSATSAATGTTNGDNNNTNKKAEKTTQRRLRNEDTQRRRRAIIGGTRADPYRYPAVVFLADREDGLSCGGTLISPTVVLTAGHCQL